MRYYQMKFNPLNNEYIVSPLEIKSVDRSKMKTDNVLKWSNNLWICTSKKRLESFAEEEIEKNIKKYLINIVILEEQLL